MNWKNSRVIGRKTQFSTGFTELFFKNSSSAKNDSRILFKKWEILEFQAENELQKCIIDCHRTFSRPYPEFSQKINEFTVKTQGNGSKTQVPGGFDHSN